MGAEDTRPLTLIMDFKKLWCEMVNRHLSSRRISSTSPIESLADFSDPPNDESVNLPVIQPIDFEYCAYNFRGYDFGNHFLEWCYDYHVYEFPWYKENLDDYPTKEQQVDLS